MAEEFREEKPEDLLSTPTTPLDRPVREKNPVKTFDPSSLNRAKAHSLITFQMWHINCPSSPEEIMHNLLYGRRRGKFCRFQGMGVKKRRINSRKMSVPFK
ncbi:hypothetical protein SUGI_0067950 [Cryptomeria japonica]|nr:hypothetical protein SUGI_0067950 [Cryptomeria japonica]